MVNQAGIFTKLDTVIVRVRDLERARAWYDEKLGLKAAFIDDTEKLAVLGTGGATSLTIYQLKPREKLVTPPLTFEASPGGERVAGTYPIFCADDIKTTYELLKSRGVMVEPEIHTGGGGQWFAFSDLDGNKMEVCHF
jgi:catechol 2,3-dioxygenase-like lactoylglutathione lyase family enzyme